MVLAVDMQGDWDLHPDGDRFIVAELVGAAPAPVVAPGARGAPASAASSERYLIVLNWFEELKERVGN